MTQAEVAAELGTRQDVVYRAMRNHGMPARPQVKRDQRGERNPSWRGVDAGYQAMHLRVYAARGAPTQCERCGLDDSSAAYDWANLTGQYDDVADYERMCRPCHRAYDAER